MSETSSTDPTVFIVDDDDRIRVSLARALSKRGFEVRVFASAEAFLESDAPIRPGCLVLDYGMPGLNGLELQKHMGSIGAQCPIIFISGQGGVPESVQAMKGGAIDFLEKPFRQEALVTCIETAFELDSRRRAARARAISVQERFELLTARELEIADFMVANPSNASSKEIGRRLDISPRTVDHHRARVLEKMNVTSIAELIELAKKAGRI